MSDGRPVVGCMPITWANPTEFSEVRQCERCQTDVWVGQSTLQGLAEEVPHHLPRFFCLICLKAEFGDEERTLLLTKAQEKLLREELGDETVDAIKQAMGIDT